MKFKMKILLALNLSLVFLLLSCSNDVLKENPPQLITTGTLYTSLNGFEIGLNGLYSYVRKVKSGVDDNKNWVICEAYMNGTDNLIANSPETGGGYGRIAQWWGNELTPYTYFNTGLFNFLYKAVNIANTIITEGESRSDIDWSGGDNTPELNKNRVLGEAKAIRAWAYRHLSYGWGDVPLALTESLGSTIKTDWERTPVEKVRRQIISDLLFAQKYVPVEPKLEGRITKGAVQHYLSEMYLVINKPDSALFWADQVINTPAYKLITQRYGVNAKVPGVIIKDMFTDGNINRSQGNTEALWVHQFAYETIGGGTVQFIDCHGSRYEQIIVNGVRPLISTVKRGGRGSNRMSFSNFALELYKWPNTGPVTKSDVLHYKDDRMSPFLITWYYILQNAAQNAPYESDRLPSGYKYGDTIWTKWSNPLILTDNNKKDWPWSNKIAVGVNPKSPNVAESYAPQIELRLAETYLLKAEAQLKLGDKTGAAATLNVIRTRSHAVPVLPDQVTLDFVLDERSRELVVEEHRRWTLLRTNKWMERTRLHNTNGGALITDRDKLFPIPQTVIDANLTKVMPQNPGYN